VEITAAGDESAQVAVKKKLHGKNHAAEFVSAFL
jgi:hypothetical protein